jgi:hypothetical protein
MKMILLYTAFIIGQVNTLQDKPVVHLEPHRDTIQIDFGGKLLQLINAPATIQLPKLPPRLDSHGNPWSIEIKNLGPVRVTVVGNGQFSLRIVVGQTVHIFSNGTSYSLK